jgi:hypothetical protein
LWRAAPCSNTASPQREVHRPRGASVIDGLVGRGPEIEIANPERWGNPRRAGDRDHKAFQSAGADRPEAIELGLLSPQAGMKRNEHQYQSDLDDRLPGMTPQPGEPDAMRVQKSRAKRAAGCTCGGIPERRPICQAS